MQLPGLMSMSLVPEMTSVTQRAEPSGWDAKYFGAVSSAAGRCRRSGQVVLVVLLAALMGRRRAALEVDATIPPLAAARAALVTRW